MTVKDRAIGSFIGLAIGDALGTPAEFKMPGEFEPITGMRGGGAFRLNPGEWTDDTSMALCIAYSLSDKGDFVPSDIMKRFVNWWQHGYASHNGRCFDIGTTTRKALQRFIKTGETSMPDTDPMASGNGAIMRFSPIATFYHDNIDRMVEVAISQAMMTHPTPESIREAETFARIIHGAMHGKTKEELIDCEKFKKIPADMVPATGYVVHTMFAAQWAVANSDNFCDALLKAVNLGDDADTVGAVTGQIAGALYGVSTIPNEWLSVLAWREQLFDLAEKLYSGQPNNDM